jgi:hypothetical protein
MSLVRWSLVFNALVLAAASCANAPPVALDLTALEVFRNNHVISPTDGCVTTFVPREVEGEELSSSCGTSADTVSTVTWSVVALGSKGCTFRFTYHPPGGSDEGRRSRTVVFRGSPVVVFDNESSRTTLRRAVP